MKKERRRKRFFGGGEGGFLERVGGGSVRLELCEYMKSPEDITTGKRPKTNPHN